MISDVDVHIFDQQKDLEISHEGVKQIVLEVLSFEGRTCNEVSIYFVDTDFICDLHDQFFDDPSTTDCISFPIDSAGDEGYCVLGEVFVCPKTAIDYAAQHEKDPYQETTLYIVHGILHLLEYDDLGESEPLMRAAETRHMNHLNKCGLLLKAKQ